MIRAFTSAAPALAAVRAALLSAGALLLVSACAPVNPETATAADPADLRELLERQERFEEAMEARLAEMERTPANGWPNLAPMLDRVRPTVVKVWNRGSGVIVNAERGHVLTNHHVIKGKKKGKVVLQDDREFDAEVIGSDGGTDVAVLQLKDFEPDELTAIELGDSKALRVGDFVAAIGHPFIRHDWTVTFGIVSALGRTRVGKLARHQDFIQVDAPINKGNSGGALINLKGELIGINTGAILANQGSGIGFAVPMALASEVMARLLEDKKVVPVRATVGFQDLSPDVAEALAMEPGEGAVVIWVEPGSAAMEAGIELGDVIVELDGQAVVDAPRLENRIRLMRNGSEVALKLHRDGGEPRALSASLVRAPLPELKRLPGVELRDLAEGDPHFGQVEGVLALRVAGGSAAQRRGKMRSGDVIVAVNHEPVGSMEALKEALEKADDDKLMMVEVRRRAVRELLFVPVKKDKKKEESKKGP